MTERNSDNEVGWKIFRCEKYPYENTTVRCIKEAKYILKCIVDNETISGNYVGYQTSLSCGLCMRHILRNSNLEYEVFAIGEKL